ncbi:VCBS repeat-containing protein [Spirosoma soli]|uniref:VCBS repeat-containing protein n=1 Tax=Spirosoma soli TaxID=1770529 RepID=A0ABW5M8W0_9BACT
MVNQRWLKVRCGSKVRLVIYFLALNTLLACTREPAEKPLFQVLDTTQTRVNFANQLQNTDSLSILDYLYFYNGGGVAAGDVNNDGLIDLYFVSNQGANKLYINQGKFIFTDVTDRAGVAGQADWQTGVTMVDVNGDGWLDIYVCAVGRFKGLKGHNELYINNQNGTFTESAAKYGLDFVGFSTQAAFFDYDHDGDLDCFLLNHAVHTSRSFDMVSARNNRSRESGDYLFRNDSGPSGSTFTDVSEKAGIYGAAMGYGLGISVADLNNDGWEDMYVSNDFHEDDYYYVNNHKGGFTESVRQAFQHTSRFSMGNDIADINNDGYPDVMTLDMYPADETVEKSSQGEDPLDIYRYKLSYGYMDQYSRNCLQLSQAGKKFMDIGIMAGVAATDWSWSPLLADYDNDGIKDLFIANGIVRRPNDLDYIKYLSDKKQTYQTTRDNDTETIQQMPEGKVHNYLYRGSSALRFVDKSSAWGFEKPTFSCGATYADLDNDGDLDLVTNNINEAASVYQNNAETLFPKNKHLTVRLKGESTNTFGVGAKVILKYKDSLQLQQLMPTRGFESSVAPELLFGLGQRATIDSLVVIWPNQRMEVQTNVKTNQTLTVQQTDARLDGTTYHYTPSIGKPLFAAVTDTTLLPFVHRENKQYYDFVRESLMPFKVSTEGPHLAVGDVNGDGLDDVYAGGARDQAGSLLIQQSNGRFFAASQACFAKDSVYEDVDASFFDADGDKDLDLYVVSGGNEFSGKAQQLADRLYINDGRGSFSRSINALPPMYDNKSCVRPCDVDHDGDLDLFVGGRVVGLAYGKAPGSYLLINDGKGRNGEPHFSDQTDQRADKLRNVGMVTDAVWIDYDQDKDLDLMVVGDWMPIRLFANNNGQFKEVTSIVTDEVPLHGFWQRITAADFDRDGDMDLVAANIGLNTKLRKQPSEKLRMWVKDIDNNQTAEQILAYNVLDNWYPIATKDELGKQIPSIINRRYTTYKAYAGQPVQKLFTTAELNQADELNVDQFASIYLENRDGKFALHELPMLAQVSKLFALLPIDIDHDGDLDILGGGNFYGVSTYQGRYDASYGLILRNDGKSSEGDLQLTPLSPIDCGFMLNGEVRDIQTVKTAQGLLITVARNGQSIQLFRPFMNQPVPSRIATK